MNGLAVVCFTSAEIHSCQEGVLTYGKMQTTMMSRYRGPRLRIVRRLGDLPGLTRKTPERKTPPGQHGATAKKPSQYGVRLMEKQKLRFNYGVTEHQLINYVKKARYKLECTPLCTKTTALVASLHQVCTPTIH